MTLKEDLEHEQSILRAAAQSPAAQRQNEQQERRWVP